MLLFHLHYNYCGQDWEQSKTHDIRPSNTHKQTQRHTHTYPYSYIGHTLTSQKYHQYSLPEPPRIFPNAPPSPGASCFWDWFHLFNDGCANDPSHMADGVTDTTTSQEWGLDQGLESKGSVILNRAEWRKKKKGEQQKDGGGLRYDVCRRSLSFSNKQGHWIQDGN